MTPQEFSIESFVKPNSDITLKHVGVEQTDEGLKPVSKYEVLADLVNLNGTYGAFLTTDLPEDERETADRYYISATNPENRGMRTPVATLKFKKAGDEKAEFICGLFIRVYNDGNIGLIGTDKDNFRRYGVFINQAKQGEKLAVNS